MHVIHYQVIMLHSSSFPSMPTTPVKGVVGGCLDHMGGALAGVWVVGAWVHGLAAVVVGEGGGGCPPNGSGVYAGVW